MKKIIFLIIIMNLTIAICLKAQDNQWLLKQRLPGWAEDSFTKNFNHNYELSTFINPFYLEADFNGDSHLNIAIAIESKQNHKLGILIVHQSSNQFFFIGAGTSFGNGGDDFRWMDVWKVNRKLRGYELTFRHDGDIDGSRPLTIKFPGIDVIKTESAAGLIYWDGQAYKWAQTSD